MRHASGILDQWHLGSQNSRPPPVPSAGTETPQEPKNPNRAGVLQVMSLVMLKNARRRAIREQLLACISFNLAWGRVLALPVAPQ